MTTVTQVITAYSDTSDNCLQWHKWWLPTVTRDDCLQWHVMTAYCDTSDDCLQWHKWWLPTVTQMMTACSGTCDDCLVRHTITALVTHVMSAYSDQRQTSWCLEWLTLKMLKIFTTVLYAVNIISVKPSRTLISARAHSPPSYCE